MSYLKQSTIFYIRRAKKVSIMKKISVSFKEFEFFEITWIPTDAYPGLPQIAKLEIFATLVNGEKPLTIIANLSILNIYGSPGYASDLFA